MSTQPDPRVEWPCMAVPPGNSRYKCSLAPGHEGNHMAKWQGFLYASWTQETNGRSEA